MLSTFFDIIQIVCMEVAIQCTTAIESPFHGRMSIMKALLDHKASSGLLLRCDDSETTPSPLSLHGRVKIFMKSHLFFYYLTDTVFAIVVPFYALYLRAKC